MNKNKIRVLEHLGRKIPDPVMIFVSLCIIILVVTALFGGRTFSMVSPSGIEEIYEIKNMLSGEGIRWIFSNAIMNNWLGYSNGIIGTILIVMFGVGVAEQSGLMSTLIKRVGTNISDKYMPFILVFLGIISNIATDAGYIILIPLAAILYIGIGKNPLIGMAAAFAGVSAGFSANIIPATVVDVIIGTNAKAFAEGQGIPFVSYLGYNLNSATMHYYFMLASTVLLVLVGGFVTIKIIKPKLRNEMYEIKNGDVTEFALTKNERRALWYSFIGFCVAIAVAILLAVGPLSSYIDKTGNKVSPFLDNIILIITMIFFVPGTVFGYATGKFKKSADVVGALSKQIGSMGYVLVLTFFCYNTLSLLSYTNIGTYITYIGATFLQSLGVSNSPLLMIIAFIIITGIVNLFVGGLSSKWMLLGPIFVPMLYRVNSSVTPEIVAAAYRIADSSTNIITPLMTYAGVVLMYMRKYKKDFTAGDLISLMIPYSVCFAVFWTLLLLCFIVFKIPLGF